jgi:hypothetical protein
LTITSKLCVRGKFVKTEQTILLGPRTPIFGFSPSTIVLNHKVDLHGCSWCQKMLLLKSYRLTLASKLCVRGRFVKTEKTISLGPRTPIFGFSPSTIVWNHQVDLQGCSWCYKMLLVKSSRLTLTSKLCVRGKFVKTEKTILLGPRTPIFSFSSSTIVWNHKVDLHGCSNCQKMLLVKSY